MSVKDLLIWKASADYKRLEDVLQIAGIGRTGCFIATTIGCRQLELEGVVDVLGIVCQLRTDRGGMIQTEEQYEFVHHALSLYESRLPAEPGQ